MTDEEIWWIGLSGQGQVVGAWRTQGEAEANTKYVVGLKPHSSLPETPKGQQELLAGVPRYTRDEDLDGNHKGEIFVKLSDVEALLSAADTPREELADKLKALIQRWRRVKYGSAAVGYQACASDLEAALVAVTRIRD